jgi:hypothetical protein
MSIDMKKTQLQRMPVYRRQLVMTINKQKRKT